MQQKIKSIHEIRQIVGQLRSAGERVVHCHGVFDLLHPGHIRHLQQAKSLGNTLVVSVTADRFVNKGPGRPAFHQSLRLEQLACLTFVDYVVLNDSPDAVSIIHAIKPDIYAKGSEYQNHADDITGKIRDEAQAVQQGGGVIHYTDGIVFSSSQLLNNYVDEDLRRIKPFLDAFKTHYSGADILNKLELLTSMNVLVIGDAIIDEYQYVQPLGQSGKGLHMTAACQEKEVFLGGSLIIANHIASFVEKVTLLTAVGTSCPHLGFIEKNLHPKVRREFTLTNGRTLTKKRYVLKDGQTISKLFETYSSLDVRCETKQEDKILQFLQEHSHEYDLVLVPDFGNGFITPSIVQALSCVPTFLSVNTQTNSGNRGFHVALHYQRADFLSINEPELRLAAHDRYSDLAFLAAKIAKLMHCPALSITKGVHGVYIYALHEDPISIPALTMHSIDRVGAGDCYFAIASLCAAKQFPMLLTGFLGSLAAAMGVQIVGNKEAIDKIHFSKYVTRLLK